MDVCLAFLGRRLYITVRYVCMYVCMYSSRAR